MLYNYKSLDFNTNSSVGQGELLLNSSVSLMMQLTKAYQNLQNMSRRLLYVHEPLIYDAVWLTAEALERSLPILNDSNLTLNSSQQNQAVKEVVQNTLNSSIFSGLTVS